MERRYRYVLNWNIQPKAMRKPIISILIILYVISYSYFAKENNNYYLILFCICQESVLFTLLRFIDLIMQHTERATTNAFNSNAGHFVQMLQPPLNNLQTFMDDFLMSSFHNPCPHSTVSNGCRKPRSQFLFSIFRKRKQNV